MPEIVDRTPMPAPSGSLSDAVTERLREAIITGELAPGAKLSEPELSQRLGIGRGSLREALQRLEGMRLVERRPRVGARVAGLGRRELVELYTVREALESMACRLAADLMSADEIADIRRLLVGDAADLDARMSAASDREGLRDFHFRIVQGSGNHELELMMNDLSHRVRRYRYRSRQIPGHLSRGLRDHHRILDAIEARDGELAEMLMRRHIRAECISVEAAMGDGVQSDGGGT